MDICHTHYPGFDQSLSIAENWDKQVFGFGDSGFLCECWTDIKGQSMPKQYCSDYARTPLNEQIWQRNISVPNDRLQALHKIEIRTVSLFAEDHGQWPPFFPNLYFSILRVGNSMGYMD